MIKFKCMKKTIEISLDKAREWYKKGGELAEIALTAFSKKELDENIEWDYDELLEKFAKKYPIGTIVWSNDGTDYFPNVIVSKPYLKDVDWSVFNIKKHIVFDTKRILLTGTCSSRIEIRDKREFDEIKIHSYSHPEAFNYKKWKQQYISEHNRMIEHWTDIIDKYNKDIKNLTQQIFDYKYEIDNFDEMFDNCKNQIMSKL